MTQSNRRTAKWRIGVLGLLAALLLTSGLSAASTPLQTIELARAVGAAGATMASAGPVTLRGTLGQPFAGVSSSGDVDVEHGFWHGAAAEYAVYLPLVMRNY